MILPCLALTLLFNLASFGIDERIPSKLIGLVLGKGGSAMTNRRDMMIWMKDLIDHMAHCHDQLQWASDGPMEAFLADSLLGDLTQCQRLCEQLRQSRGAQEKRAQFDADESHTPAVSFRNSLAFA